MATASATTLHLAMLLGIYIMAAGLGLFVDPNRGSRMIGDLERSPGLIYLLAVLAFTIGALMILFHNLWSDPLAIIVTIGGWAALFEGIVLLAFPALWFAIASPFVERLRATAAVMILFGGALLVAGLTANAAPIVQ